MECPRCSNKDPAYFYKGSKGYYCRKCVSFARTLLEEDLEPLDYTISNYAQEYDFNYELTDSQKRASRQCLDSIKTRDVLLHCVCGARQNGNIC